MSKHEVSLNPTTLPIGQHFWAKMDGHLVMMMKTKQNDFDVCGPWEGGAGITEFEIIELVGLPKGFSTNDLYYK